jgi:hypothetical protein
MLGDAFQGPKLVAGTIVHYLECKQYTTEFGLGDLWGYFEKSRPNLNFR